VDVFIWSGFQLPRRLAGSGIIILVLLLALVLEMKRVVQPELLDELPPDDPRALHSRRDLRRINAWMGNRAVLVRALQTGWNGQAPKQITELGAGDGNFLLGVARKTSSRWPKVNVTLIDLQNNVTPQTLASFASLNWRAEAVVADVFEWSQASAPAEIVTANLVLHHFDDVRLAGLFRAIAARSRLFIAIEPRRGPWPLFCARLLWAIGCNSVTRHDAVVSMRAGFFGAELSALWPEGGGWQLTEHRTGLFSHLFVARKIQ